MEYYTTNDNNSKYSYPQCIFTRIADSFFFGSNKYIMTVDVNVTDFFVL